MPKAVCNAYMIFCKSRRNELKYDNPDLPFGKIGAKLGEMWRNMTSEAKRPYDDRAAVDRERYRREMIDYQAGKGGEKRQKVKHEDEEEEESGGSAQKTAHKKTSSRQVKREEPDEEEGYSDEDEE
jgi:hypothetical protein